jgi:small subunit ribosomal protein S1
MTNVNENEEIFSMGDVMDKVDASMKRIHTGDVLKGRVIAVTDNKVLVNIGYISDGIIEREEMTDNPEISPKELVKINDEIYVYVIDANDEGTVLLSKKKAEAVKIWDDFEESIKNSKPMEIRVSEVVNGGVIAKISGIRAFIPASHLSYKRVENLNDFVGKTVTAKVIELDREKEKVVFSVKELEKKENENKRYELLKTIKKGDIIKGVVSRLAKFGAFVDLGGIDGLVHLSELSWKRVNDPSEIVNVGDEVEVYVLNVDAINNKISLGLRNVNENPWKNVLSNYRVDSIVAGKVVRVTDFGAFVEIGEGVEGLVHISQISDEHIARPSSVLSVGDAVKVKILDIKEAEQRISLSIKDATEGNLESVDEYCNQELGTTIGDALKGKLKDFKFD